MKKIYLLGIFFFVCILCTSPATALFTTLHPLNGTLTEDTEVFFLGKTSLNGTFTGQPLQNYVNSSFVQQMGGFPLIDACTFPNLHTVIVAEDVNLTTATTLEEFIAQYYDHITSYSDVNLITQDGLFLLGIKEGNIRLSSDLPYAVTTVVPFEITPDNITRFLVLGTTSQLHMQCLGDYAILTTLSDSGAILLQRNDGSVLWSGGSPNDYIFIQDQTFSLLKDSSLSMFPLSSSSSILPFSMTVTPAAPEDIQVQQLIQNVSKVLGTFGNDSSSDFLQRLNDLDAILQASSFIANGAMILQLSNDSITIDHTTQRFSSNGFVRFNTLEITDFSASSGPAISGGCTLCYLGDHFYNPSAKRSTDGIVFPFELLFIWILSLCVFLYVRFFLKPPIDIRLDQKVKRYALYIHLAALILTILLLDYEVYTLFGFSALTSLLSQGFSASTIAFLLLESLVWILGFFLLALPLQLLSNAILHFLGIGKGGNGVWKAIGDLSIWVFCGLYLLLFFNIFLSVIDVNSLFAMG
jgi:hypothetical protein